MNLWILYTDRKLITNDVIALRSTSNKINNCNMRVMLACASKLEFNVPNRSV
jgi:hypothetical protein